jgi:hypothetical protein
MSFARSFDEARGIIDYVQYHKLDGNDGSPMSSPILHGQANGQPDVSAPVSELVPRRTKIHTRTDSLTRQYGATGSGEGGRTADKSYGSTKGKSRKSRVDL